MAATSAAMAKSQNTTANTLLSTALPVGLACTTSFSPVSVSTFFFLGAFSASALVSEAFTTSRLISFAIMNISLQICLACAYLSAGFFCRRLFRRRSLLGHSCGLLRGGLCCRGFLCRCLSWSRLLLRHALESVCEQRSRKRAQHI